MDGYCVRYVLSGEDGDDNAKCELSSHIFSHGGANDIVKHLSSKNHLQLMSSSSFTQTLDRFGFGQSKVAKRVRQKKE